MSDHGTLAGYLRFFARKTDRTDPDVGAMMAMLDGLAHQLETQGTMTIERADLPAAGRALAGVAGFLQQHILPEAVANGHAPIEAQVRWTIDSLMDMMTQCMTHAEIAKDDGALVLTPGPKSPP